MDLKTDNFDFKCCYFVLKMTRDIALQERRLFCAENG
jgi:hypothetical protein